MFKNYLKTAVRHLLQHKSYSLINIGGLALGIACCMLILLYVQDELSYDRFHQEVDRTYRVVQEAEGFGLHANTPPPLAPALKQIYPEIKHVTRVFRHWRAPLVANEQKGFIENEFFYADNSFFEVFSFSLLRGDPTNALHEPLSVIISETMAHKYFGKENPVGKVLRHNTQLDFRVTGVMVDPPHNTHFHPDFIASISSLPQVMWPKVMETWSLGAFKTYVVLSSNASAEILQNKIVDFYPQHRGENEKTKLHLQPVAGIHLHSHLPNELEANSDIRYVYLLTALAAIILIIAAINYVNLATARSSARAKEVGMRKVVGAHRRNLINQFLGESILLSLVALLLAAVTIELAVPVLNQLTGKRLAMNYLENHWITMGVLGITLFIGLIAGSYPALFLARFQPIKVLKGRIDTGYTSGAGLRKSLVVVQFAASVALIAGTIVILQQLEYIRTAKLGFDREQVVVLPVRDEALSQRTPAIRQELLANPNVIAVGAANSFPGRGHASDDVRWEGAGDDQSLAMYVNWIDDHLLATLGIELAAGRAFSSEFETDWTESVLINEAAVKAIGWNSPATALGKKVFAGGTDRPEGRRVIGVVRDYHFESLHHQIEPMVLIPQRDHLSYLLIRIRPDDIAGTLSSLRAQWQALSAQQPFTYSFLDQDFDKLYESEQRWSRTLGYGAMVAILIAGLGLFGLASFMTERRKKEIGIRKVLGASVAGIVSVLSMDFIKLVVLANVIAWPVAYYAMNKWLQDFAYRIEIGVGTFFMAGVLALLIAFLTVSTQAIKAALTNPVEALRYE